MGIYMRGRIYWGRFQFNGKEIRDSLETTSRREAKQLFDEWKSDKLRELRGKLKGRHTWDDACARYIEEVMPSKVRPLTAKRYLVSFRAVLPILSGKPLYSIGRADVLRVANRKGPTVATRKRDLTAVSQVFRAATVWEWIDTNPVKAADLDAVIKERRDPIVLPTDEDIERFIVACPGELARMARFLLLTGLRLSEATTLRWTQVATDDHQPDLSIIGKRNKVRSVPLTKEAVSVLQSAPRHITSAYIFWHDNGEPYRQASTQLALVRKRLGIPFRTHDLRHRFAVDYLKNCGSIYRLQQILGHSNIAVTEIYLAHITPEEAERAKKGNDALVTDLYA